MHWYTVLAEKAMTPHSSTLAWKIPWTEEPGGLQSMGSLTVGHDWVTSLSLFTLMRWRRKWQPTPVFLPWESQGWGSLVGCRLRGRRVRHDRSDLAAAAAARLLNIFCRSITFLSFIEPIFAWNVPLVSLMFLKISSLSHSFVFLYFFASITRKAFLSLLAILWNSAFRYLSFSPLLLSSLLFTAIGKASPDSHFAFMHTPCPR